MARKEPTAQQNGDGDDDQEPVELLKQNLDAALARIEEMDLELATFQGREIALHVARDDATKRGRPWTKAEVRRFKFLPSIPVGFESDALRELLDRALPGVRKRVVNALRDGVRARDHAYHAHTESTRALDEAAAAFKDPNAEHLIRQAARAYAHRAHKTCGLLIATLRTLEEEAAMAQSVHAADMRSLATRLMAQRDAAAACITLELEDAEIHGGHSMAGLQKQLDLVQEQGAAQIAARDAQIRHLQEQLAETQAAHEAEKVGRFFDQQRNALELGLMRLTVDGLESDLGHSDADLVRTSAERRFMAAELASEERARELDAKAAHQCLLDEEAKRLSERREVEKKLNISLQANGLAQQAEQAEKEAVYRKAEALEAGLRGQLKRLRAAKESETTALQSKIHLLSSQVSALRASKSVRRSYLYFGSMVSMKAKRAEEAGDGTIAASHACAGDTPSPSRAPETVHEAFEALRLADPADWRKPQLPPEAFAVPR